MKTKLLVVTLALVSSGTTALATEPLTPFQQSVTVLSEVARSPEVAAKFPAQVTAQAVSSLGWDRYRVFASNGCHVDVRASSDYVPHPTHPELNVLAVKLTQVGPLTCE